MAFTITVIQVSAEYRILPAESQIMMSLGGPNTQNRLTAIAVNIMDQFGNFTHPYIGM
jgi:hypothetical protein